MVRERDATNPRQEQLAAALEEPDPIDALMAVTRVLAAWWQDINPIAQALYGAALTDDAARAAWEDRMTHLMSSPSRSCSAWTRRACSLPGWDVAHASDWLANQLNPLGWVLLTDAGWSQRTYEERMTAVVGTVLVGK